MRVIMFIRTIRIISWCRRNCDLIHSKVSSNQTVWPDHPFRNSGFFDEFWALWTPVIWNKRCLFGISINHLGSIETFTISTGERRISKNHPPVIHRSLAAVVRCCSVPATVPLHSSLDVSRPQPSLDGAVPRTAPGFRVGRLAGKTTGFFHPPPKKKWGGLSTCFTPQKKYDFLESLG